MKFFLDTANLNEIREGAALGLADGVTTIHHSSQRKAGSTSNNTSLRSVKLFRDQSRLK